MHDIRDIRQTHVRVTLVALVLSLSIPPAVSMQLQNDDSRTTLATAEPNQPKSLKVTAENGRRPGTHANRADSEPAQRIETDKITSFFVRTNDSKRIHLSMLVAYKEELTQAVRELVGQRVTPLVFSVSTLPNRSVRFDPTLLRFEQNGRVWQPQAESPTLDFFPLEEGDEFGGVLDDGKVQQGVILLPTWFNPRAPITLRYGDFHYLARFVQADH